MFGAEEIGVEIAEIAFLSETQYVKNFLNPMDVDGSSEGTWLRHTTRPRVAVPGETNLSTQVTTDTAVA